MDKGRLLALTDGIIAIAATIMVLELEIPDRLSGAALLGQLPTIMAYIISYLQIWIVLGGYLIAAIGACFVPAMGLAVVGVMGALWIVASSLNVSQRS